MTKRPTGRRPGDPDDTRRAIVDAARRTFAAHGFDRATIRAIAAEADVDPALIPHHFGNKRGLFVAAHELPVDPAELISSVAALPIAERGEAAARSYLHLFAGQDSTGLSLLRAAATDPDAAAMLREFIEDTVVQAGLGLLENPEIDGELRVALIASHLLGVAVARRIVGVSPLADRNLDELVAAMAPVIQHYIAAP
jgi:AcrR family transcriptional regulator